MPEIVGAYKMPNFVLLEEWGCRGIEKTELCWSWSLPIHPPGLGCWSPGPLEQDTSHFMPRICSLRGPCARGGSARCKEACLCPDGVLQEREHLTRIIWYTWHWILSVCVYTSMTIYIYYIQSAWVYETSAICTVSLAFQQGLSPFLLNFRIYILYVSKSLQQSSH